MSVLTNLHSSIFFQSRGISDLLITKESHSLSPESDVSDIAASKNGVCKLSSWFVVDTMLDYHIEMFDSLKNKLILLHLTPQKC